MSKLVRGPVSICVMRQTQQFDNTEHLPFSEQFETIQKQGRLEAVAKETETPSNQWH